MCPSFGRSTCRQVSAGALTLPNRATSVKFAVIGDSGRGTPPQHEIAAQMVAFREHFPFAFVLMLGDNIYEGPATREDYRRKFEEPYRALLDEGVKFYAALGNHDDPRQIAYPLFNMDGERYYSFSPPEDLLAKVVTPRGVLRRRLDQSRSHATALARRAPREVGCRRGRCASFTIRSTRPGAIAHGHEASA